MRPIPCPISREELFHLYTQEQLTDQQIVDILGAGATLKRVRSWRRRFGVETLSRAERNEVTPIEGALRSLLVGSMLGDGRIAKAGTSARYAENHAANQREYLEWKVAQWGTWPSSTGIREVIWRTKGGDFKGYRFHTLSHPSLLPWHDLFYPTPGPKQLLPEVVGMVDAAAVAVWYMDDGSSQWWPVVTFGLSLQSRGIALALFDKFGFSPKWSHSKGLTGQFILDGEDQAERFITLVRPHVPECMRYKLEFGFQGRHYDIRKAAPESTLRQLARAGTPIRRMARLLGLSASVVSRRLERLGIEHHRTVGRPCSKVRALVQQ